MEIKGMSNESFEVVSKTDNTLTPSVNYYGEKVRLRFVGSVLQQKAVTNSHEKVVNFYVVYEIINFHGLGSYPTVANADIDKYRYFGYGIGFDEHGSFSHPNGGDGRNVIIFGVDMSLFVHVDNKKNEILILGFGWSYTRIRRTFIKCRKNVLYEFC